MQKPIKADYHRTGDTRTRLLAAAAWRIHRQGFFRTSLDEIAGDVKIAKATFYHHFRNKDELGQALLRQHVAKYVAVLTGEIFTEERSGLERLQRLFDYTVDGFASGDYAVGCPIGNLVYELADHSPYYRECLRGFFEIYHDLIAAALRDAKIRGELGASVDPERVATVLLAQIQGGLVIARTAIRNDDLTVAVDTLRGLFDSFLACIQKAS